MYPLEELCRLRLVLKNKINISANYLAMLNTKYNWPKQSFSDYVLGGSKHFVFGLSKLAFVVHLVILREYKDGHKTYYSRSSSKEACSNRLIFVLKHFQKMLVYKIFLPFSR